MPLDVLMAYPIPTRDSPVRLTPLSILYPGMMFEAQGKTVAYWDDRYDSLDEFDALVRDAREIGVSAFTGYQCGRAATLLKRAKALKPGIVTHLGGHHARYLPEQCRQEPYIDNVWSGRTYGEEHFCYRPHTRRHFERGDMQYFTSRGCPFPCTFCALRSPWEPKDAVILERELKTIHHDIGFREISFCDPNIGFGVWKDEEGKTHRMDRVQRIKDIGKIMRDLGVRWDGNIRSPYLTPEMIGALAESNCYSIEIGCESGNDYFLKQVIKKGHGIDAIKQAAVNVRGSGISVMYSFLAYAPHETESQRRDTYDLIDWIVDTDPMARVSLYKFAPYPGSPLFEDAVAGRGTGFGCDRFDPPKTMEGWGSLKLMTGPLYWITGLNFRADNTRANFKGDDYSLIAPYVELAKRKWSAREMDDFPCEEVERLVEAQVRKGNRRIAEASA